MKQFYKFYQLPWRTRLLALETVYLLGVTRFLSFWLPFRFLMPHLGNVQQESRISASSAQQPTIDQVGRMVRGVSQYTPWTSNCMAQAMTAKWMLQRRGISSTLYIGVQKANEQFAAHAWLRVGEVIITGGGDLGRYKQIACFGEARATG